MNTTHLYGVIFRMALCLAALCLPLGIGGCNNKVLPKGQNLLVVNFQEGKPLRYKMTSTRDATIELSGSKSSPNQKPQKTTESVELVMAYKPIKVDPFGLTKLECTCESVSVKRASFTGQNTSTSDALENLKGKPFILELSPTGKINDFSKLETLLLEVGKTAFDSRQDARIKNPDMIYDFVAMQWYLWDSISSVPNPLDGVKPGMSWKNTQVVPWPIPIPNTPCRLTTFTLDSMQDENRQQKAVITSTYQLSDKTLDEFPKPYEGVFQMRGMFGFLRNYQFDSLEGSGRQVFNLTTGTVESETQQYKLKSTASFIFSLGDSVPHLTIDQKIEIQRIEQP